LSICLNIIGVIRRQTPVVVNLVSARAQRHQELSTELFMISSAMLQLLYHGNQLKWVSKMNMLSA